MLDDNGNNVAEAGPVDAGPGPGPDQRPGCRRQLPRRRRGPHRPPDRGEARRPRAERGFAKRTRRVSLEDLDRC
ncbi:hypothetical protein LT493_18380 [Streptomyces tricolor]|nr:hypothetical protein [Streptomyces tricolor]